MNNSVIKDVYNVVSKDLNTVYKKRKVTAVFQKIMWGITGLFFLLMFLNMIVSYFPNQDNIIFNFLRKYQATQSNPYATTYPYIGLVILLYPTIYIFSNAFRKFKEKEAAIINKMIKMLFPKVEFTQNTTTPTKEINKSKLFAWVKPDTIMYSYGQIRNTVNDTQVNIADIGIIEENASTKALGALMRIPMLNILIILYQYVLKNVSSSKSADNVYYTFRGMFCWLSYPKKLNGHTVVLTNDIGTKLDRLTSFNFSEEQKIQLEDPRFTNQFIVYSTDQTEARYVLSTALMENIVQLKDKFNQSIMLSFHNQQMYLTVQNANGLFSIPSGKLDSIKIVEELANDIETALHIAEELKFKKVS